MKSSKSEIAAVAAADKQAKKAVAAAKKPRETKSERERREAQARDVWMQTTKIIVPIWFGSCSAMQGMKLSQQFGPAGALALAYVGKHWRAGNTEGSISFSMELTLRGHGFDRREARELADLGFIEAYTLKLLKRLKKKPGEELDRFTLTAKGEKWFTLLEKSSGCAPKTTDDEQEFGIGQA